MLLAAIAVFAVVVSYNDKTEPAYEAKMIKATLAETVKTAKQTATTAAVARVVKTNTVARQKIKNTNL